MRGREGDRQDTRKREQGERATQRERERMGEGEFKDNTREESRLIYFICRNRKNLKRKKKKVSDSEKESVGFYFHEQAA